MSYDIYCCCSNLPMPKTFVFESNTIVEHNLNFKFGYSRTLDGCWMCNDGIQVKLVIIQLVVYDNSSSLLFITLFYANIDIFLLATIRFLLTCYVFSLLLLLILYLNAELYYLCYYANKVTSLVTYTVLQIVRDVVRSFICPPSGKCL